jgi:hypothetical protein
VLSIAARSRSSRHNLDVSTEHEIAVELDALGNKEGRDVGVPPLIILLVF